MKKLIVLFFFLLAGLTAKSQTAPYYTYSYDNNGNRYMREYTPLRIVHDTVVTDSTTNTTDSTANAIDSVAIATVNQTTQQQQQQQYETMLGEQKITAFPNPTKDEITINISNFTIGNKGSILVSDMQGRVIYKKENINSTNIINLSSAATGKYVMKLILNGKSNEWVVVKE